MIVFVDLGVFVYSNNFRTFAIWDNSKSTYLLNFEPPEPPDDLNFWVGGFGGLD